VIQELFPDKDNLGDGEFQMRRRRNERYDCCRRATDILLFIAPVNSATAPCLSAEAQDVVRQLLAPEREEKISGSDRFMISPPSEMMCLQQKLERTCRAAARIPAKVRIK